MVEGPVARAEPIDMEEFVRRMTQAVVKGMLSAGLNPQPLPPKEGQGPPQEEAAPLNPQPLPPFDITVGLIVSTGEGITVLRGSKI